MRVSVMVHSPLKGKSLEWRLQLVYRDGSSRLAQLHFLEWSDVEAAAQAYLDNEDVVTAVVLGRPAVEFRSTRGHDVDGWRVDARYTLGGWADLEYGDDFEGGAR